MMGKIAQMHATRRQRGAAYLVAERTQPGRAQVVHADSLKGAENMARNVMAYADPVVTLYSNPSL